MKTVRLLGSWTCFTSNTKGTSSSGVVFLRVLRVFQPPCHHANCWGYTSQGLNPLWDIAPPCHYMSYEGSRGQKCEWGLNSPGRDLKTTVKVVNGWCHRPPPLFNDNCSRWIYYRWPPSFFAQIRSVLHSGFISVSTKSPWNHWADINVW